ISNNNLNLILANTASYSASDLELKMFEAVNQERISYNKKALVWNAELAAVAREHSQNLADEDKAFTVEGKTCDFPIIHHEGLVFGNYNADRLKNRELYYFSLSGENIALVPAVSTTVSFSQFDTKKTLFDSCVDRREAMDTAFKTKLDQTEAIEEKIKFIQAEDKMRTEKFALEQTLKIEKQRWHSSEEVVSDTVQGWMNSPGHKENILEESFDEAGMGVASVGGYLISTQVFIKRISCGYKNAECCQENANSVYCYLPFNCEASLCQ
ncbi:MAG: CAP domain-containing protein, partial [Candidatus Magasanikbacteria bacterium]|nr:CAP domain-containing protein [Candidatus Magasanikbacteria bacterium]